jgi:hypothetical protein
MGSAARISRHRSMVVLIVIIGIAVGWLIQRPAGAQTSEHVFWAVPGTGGKATFLNFDRPELRLGDRLAARGPLFDASQTTRVGRLYLDCVIMKKSPRTRSIPRVCTVASTSSSSTEATS